MSQGVDRHKVFVGIIIVSIGFIAAVASSILTNDHPSFVGLDKDDPYYNAEAAGVMFGIGVATAAVAASIYAGIRSCVYGASPVHLNLDRHPFDVAGVLNQVSLLSRVDVLPIGASLISDNGESGLPVAGLSSHVVSGASMVGVALPQSAVTLPSALLDRSSAQVFSLRHLPQGCPSSLSVNLEDAPDSNC